MLMNCRVGFLSLALLTVISNTTGSFHSPIKTKENIQSKIDVDKTYIDNSIVSLSSSGSGDDKSIDFKLKIWDWPSKSQMSNYVLNSSSALSNFNSIYNTHSKVHVYNASNSELTLTSESFINVWGGDGVFALRLQSPSVNFSKIFKVYIEAGCEFPTYAGFEGINKGSTTFDNTVYRTENDQYFYYDGTSFTEGSEFKETVTAITGVEEINVQENNSFLRLKLSNSDYSSVPSTTNVKSYINKLNELNTGDYILINGQPVKDDTAYINSERFINLFGIGGSYSFRTVGNNTGCYYLDTTKARHETEDLSVYEITIVKGCQLPSYAYISGQTSIKQCYITNRDYVFVYFDGQYVLSENLDYPYYEDTKITSINTRFKNSTDRSVDFTFSNFDWPTNDVIADKDIRNNIKLYNLNDRILFKTKDGSNLLLTSKERFMNVWGVGNKEATFSLRLPDAIIESTELEFIRIYKGAEFPSYSEYNNESTLRYRLDKTTTFYASNDGNFYLGTGLNIEEYAQAFLDAMGEVCDGYFEGKNNKDALLKKWYAFKNIYDKSLFENMIDVKFFS